MGKTLKVDNLEALNKIVSKLKDFQLIHNELRKDFLSIYKVASENTDKESIAPFSRACIKELFALIEADIYFINQFNPYAGYKDSEKTIKKFKNTYHHHGITFDKVDLYNSFLNSNFNILSDLKIIRDNTTHPKDKKSINLDFDTLIKTYDFYLFYTKFVSDMMTNVFVSTNIPINFNR